MSHLIKDIINKLEQTSNDTLKVTGVLPNLGLEIDRTLPGSAFNSQKAILMLITGKFLTGRVNTNHTLLRQMKTFTDEEGEDDPPGEICWDKEVLLTYDERRENRSLTVHYYPIEAIEITGDTFRLIAGNELLDLRIEEPPFED